MLIINGTDYGLLIICVLAFLLIAAAQYILCAKAKNLYIKLLPCVFGIFFIGFGIASMFGSSGGFLDLRGLAMLLCFAAAGICFFAQFIGWGIWKIKNR